VKEQIEMKFRYKKQTFEECEFIYRVFNNQTKNGTKYLVKLTNEKGIPEVKTVLTSSFDEW
jgi:hypothetical protein